MANFSKNFADKIKKHTLCTIMFFENSALCDETRWKDIDEPDRNQMRIWRMRIAYWLPKATNLRLQTQSECVILIASPLRQWLQEGAYLIFCAHIVCPIIVRSMTFLYSRLCLPRPLKKA